MKKHYTYDERYKMIKNKVNKFNFVNPTGFESNDRMVPIFSVKVSKIVRNKKKSIYFDIVAKKRPVGYGIDNICKLAQGGDWSNRRLRWAFDNFVDSTSGLVNHPLRNPMVSTDKKSKVVFRYKINPREGL